VSYIGWPRCMVCGAAAIDGRTTCGAVACLYEATENAAVITLYRFEKMIVLLEKWPNDRARQAVGVVVESVESTIMVDKQLSLVVRDRARELVRRAKALKEGEKGS